MCTQGDSKNTTKCVCVCFVVLILVIIGLAVSLSVMGSTGASVQMNGENDTSEIRESNGIHLLEVNGSGLESGSTGEWSYMEIGFIIMAIGFFVNVSHIFHYCVITKKLVKNRVQKDRDIELGRLAKIPSNDAIIVPALV